MMFAWTACVLISLAVGSALGASVSLASYEANETTLTVSGSVSDSGLTVEIVDGGVNGAPAATDGSRVVKLTIANEADGKIEYRHFWSGPHYDLDGVDRITADVYIEDAGALPAIMGLFDGAWNPPNAWAGANNIPDTTGVWTTIYVDLSQNAQTGLDQIWAFVFEGLAAASGTIYVDNLRLETLVVLDASWSLNANGYANGNSLVWRPVDEAGLSEYRVWRSTSPSGPFIQIDTLPADQSEYLDPMPADNTTRYYYQLTYVAGGDESLPSRVVTALYNGYTDEELLDQIQWATFRYFYNGAHPVSKLTREGINTGHSSDIVTMGGSGFGLMAVIVGAERGWITRGEAADHILTALTFLEDVADRFHGVWPHWMNGNTGTTIPFSPQDDGADLVESAFLMQGMLVARQYFDDPNDPVETEIRTRATRMWEEVEWDWFRRFPGSDILYWHWSPNFDFAMNLPIRGYMEARIVYLLAVASPTHPMPASSYNIGWAGNGGYTSGQSFYGIPVDVGWPLNSPLFFTHYSNLAFDPRYKSDAFTNYFVNSRNFSLIHQAYSIDNPNEFVGYGAYAWGLTASLNPWGYLAHDPGNDNGTIAPTAALSAMPYTPKESLAALRHFYDEYGDGLFGSYGFKDAFNPTEDWYAGGYLAIDQGPIVCMIENYRSGLLWKLFMQNPEIKDMMTDIGMYYEIDFNTDGDVGGQEGQVVLACLTGPENPAAPSCSGVFLSGSDLDNDGDVDSGDYAIAQTLFNAP
jgi:hypothetical protein